MRIAQEPEDEHGNVIGRGDLAVQARQVFSNIGRALFAAGARPEQVTKITTFVVDYRREHPPVIKAGRLALFGDHKPADTLVGVQAGIRRASRQSISILSSSRRSATGSLSAVAAH